MGPLLQLHPQTVEQQGGEHGQGGDQHQLAQAAAEGLPPLTPQGPGQAQQNQVLPQHIIELGPIKQDAREGDTKVQHRPEGLELAPGDGDAQELREDKDVARAGHRKDLRDPGGQGQHNGGENGHSSLQSAIRRHIRSIITHLFRDFQYFFRSSHAGPPGPRRGCLTQGTVLCVRRHTEPSPVFSERSISVA